MEAEVIYNDRGSKGFGFITMASRGDAVNALSRLDRIVVDGRLIQVVPVGTRELVQAEVRLAQAQLQVDRLREELCSRWRMR